LIENSTSDDVDSEVQCAVERLADALVSSPVEIVVALVRRLPRIFDAFLGESELRRRLDEKMVYSTCLDLVPALVRGRSVALVDDCVQRGISLRSHHLRLTRLARQVLVYALARSRWHSSHGQFSGLVVQEPVLDLEPEGFELATSHINDVLFEFPTPMDCEDRFIRVVSSATSADLVRALSRVSALIELPSAPYSRVKRYSQFLGVEHAIAAGLATNSQAEGITLDRELKIAWTVSDDGSVFLLPVCLFSVVATAPLTRRGTSRPSELVRFAEFFPEAEPRRRLLEAAELWASSEMAGRIWRTISSAGFSCTFECSDREFRRSYGADAGSLVHRLYLENMHHAFERFEPPAIDKGSSPSKLGLVRSRQLAFQVRALLERRYREANAGRSRIEYKPTGLGFSELLSGLNAPPAMDSAAELSAVLDDLLAASWIKSTAEESGPCVRAAYFCTEQNSGRAQEEHEYVSFSRPADWKRVRMSQGLVRAFADVLPAQHDPGAAGRAIRSGYFQHGLVVALHLLGDLRRNTMLLASPQPHGMVVCCDPANSYVSGGGSIEENQALLGLTITDQAVMVDTPRDLLRHTPIQHEVLLLAREFGDLLRLIQATGVSVGDTLLLLSTCFNSVNALTGLAHNLRKTQEALVSIGRGVSPAEGLMRTAYHHLSGARDKLRVIPSAPAIARVARDLAVSVQLSPSFQRYVDSIAPDLPSNAWLAVLGQLVAEAEYHCSVARRGQPDLFSPQGPSAATAMGPDQLARIHAEWSERVRNLAFLRDSAFALPHAALIERRSRESWRGRVAFVKVDRARHGGAESAADVKERTERHFPLFRSVAGFYHGFEARDPEGDALLFAFPVERNAVRFVHALVLLVGAAAAVTKSYRVVAVEGEAQFEEDGNINSPSAVDLLPDIEAAVKQYEANTEVPSAAVGSLLDDGLWPSLAADFQARGLVLTETTGQAGKRVLPGPVRCAVLASPTGQVTSQRAGSAK
jgi:hypothetical protein